VNTGTRQSSLSSTAQSRATRSSQQYSAAAGAGTAAARCEPPKATQPKSRVFVAAENRLLQEALARMLTKNGNLEVVGGNSAVPFHAELLFGTQTNILLLASRGKLAEDLPLLRKVRTTTPEVRILLLGMSKDETDFFQCVRAGISGYLLRDASAEEVLEGVRLLQKGEVVCPGALCAVLFRHFERDATSFPSARVQQLLGLTRREQQLVPLIAQGMTNKEIANHFCLSEQTVKNHLYRMKHRVGADNRLGIVQLCRNHGFLP
jgi:DNA-binding NarL/FixJ family response regulator